MQWDEVSEKEISDNEEVGGFNMIQLGRRRIESDTRLDLEFGMGSHQKDIPTREFGLSMTRCRGDSEYYDEGKGGPDRMKTPDYGHFGVEHEDCDWPLKRPSKQASKRNSLQSFGGMPELESPLKMRKRQISQNNGGLGLMAVNSFGSKDENLTGMTCIDTTVRARNSDRDIETPCLIAPNSGAQRKKSLSMRGLEWMSEDSHDNGSMKIKKKGKASGFRMGSEYTDPLKGDSPRMGEVSLGVIIPKMMGEDSPVIITPNMGAKSQFVMEKSPALYRSITFSE
jgi:hypothetical protein